MQLTDEILNTIVVNAEGLGVDLYEEELYVYEVNKHFGTHSKYIVHHVGGLLDADFRVLYAYQNHIHSYYVGDLIKLQSFREVERFSNSDNKRLNLILDRS